MKQQYCPQNTATEEEQRWGGQVGGVAKAVDFKELKKEVVEKHETVVKGKAFDDEVKLCWDDVWRMICKPMVANPVINFA